MNIILLWACLCVELLGMCVEIFYIDIDNTIYRQHRYIDPSLNVTSVYNIYTPMGIDVIIYKH